MHGLSHFLRAAPRQSGFAHLAALLVTLLLSAIAASFVVEARVSSVAATAEVGVAQARMAADAGVRHAIFQLASRLGRAGDEREALAPLWRRSDRFWTFAGARVEITVQAEADKIDLNTAPGDVLRRLMLGAGLGRADANAVVENILRYRQRDGATPTMGVSAQAQGGIVLAMTDELDSKAFDSIQEILRVPGITPDLFGKLSGQITVYGSPWARRSAGAEVPAGADGTVTYAISATARNDGGAVFVRDALVSFVLGRRVRHRIHTWRQGMARQPAAAPSVR